MAKYIFRLDDACSTMNKEKWRRIEYILYKYGVKPIVAVIPNNKDTTLIIDSEDKSFWNRVQQWQEENWSIALHGYDHVYISSKRGIVPIHNRSEFAGLGLEQQKIKISNGIRIFNEKGIKPTIWVAPSHSLDINTLEAIKSETDIKIISDGVAFKPYTYKELIWIPQQVWKFKRKIFGIWTICVHPNEMNERKFIKLEKFIIKNRVNIITVDTLLIENRSRNLLDYLLCFWILLEIRIKIVFKNFLK